jgi:hypothetical protein
MSFAEFGTHELPEALTEKDERDPYFSSGGPVANGP